MKDRGMMKWLSYKSLSEQERYLSEMMDKKEEIDKPLLSEEKAEEINEILTTYAGEEVCLYFYMSGHVKQSRGAIDRIDPIYRVVEMNDIRIRFSEIVGLEQI